MKVLRDQQTRKPVRAGPCPPDDNYNINAAAVTVLSDEIQDYDDIITLPQQSIAGRKALTQDLRPRFAAVEALFADLDCVIVQFNTTPAGRALIAAYFAARVIRDLGASGSSTPPTPQPPTGPGT